MFEDVSFEVSETVVAHCWGLQSGHCSCILVHEEGRRAGVSPVPSLYHRHIQPSLHYSAVGEESACWIHSGEVPAAL